MKTTKQQAIRVRILGENIIVGPGTVPSSGASASGTVINDVISLSKKASKDGIFEDKEQYGYQTLGRHSS